MLNTIFVFHVTRNYSVDLMHDLFEGVCHYDLCHIINYFTNEIKIFSLDVLNARKQNFSYIDINKSYVSQPTRLSHLKNKKLKVTASEMKVFIQFFPLMIGDLVAANDPVWIFL